MKGAVNDAIMTEIVIDVIMTEIVIDVNNTRLKVAVLGIVTATIIINDRVPIVHDTRRRRQHLVIVTVIGIEIVIVIVNVIVIANVIVDIKTNIEVDFRLDQPLSWCISTRTT
jgi:hypothetical protein